MLKARFQSISSFQRILENVANYRSSQLNNSADLAMLEDRNGFQILVVRADYRNAICSPAFRHALQAKGVYILKYPSAYTQKRMSLYVGQSNGKRSRDYILLRKNTLRLKGPSFYNKN